MIIIIIKLNNKRIRHSSRRIIEASRQDLLIGARRGSKQRYKKRLNYQISNFKGVDLSELFNNDYFVFRTPINNYEVIIAFPGVLSELKEVVKATHGDVRRINLQLVIKALRKAFDKADDVKIRCSCGDFRYRFMYYAWKNDYLYGKPTPGTEEPPKITNPDNNLGPACKHLNLFLSNKKWLTKAASVVNALIKTYPDKAAYYLYDEDEIIDDNQSNETENDELDNSNDNQDNNQDSNEINNDDQDKNDQDDNQDNELNNDEDNERSQ